jgi:tetratricopeptide (TPR) repeat protein
MHKSWYNCLGLSGKVQPMLIRAIDVARRIGDNSCLLDCLWAMFGTRLTQARYGDALSYARQFQQVAEGSEDKAQHAMAHRIVALSMWRDGEFQEAASHGQAALQSNAHLTAHVQLDLMYKQGVASRANMSNLLWLLGRADAALDLAHEAVAIGLSSDLLGLSYGLGQTIIPLMFWVGDVQQAESLAALLVKISVDNDFGYWVKWGKVYLSAANRLKNGDGPEGDALVDFKGEMDGLQRHILATILTGLPIDWVTECDHGDRRTGPHWCTAELQRVAGLHLMRNGDLEGARAQFEDALGTAFRQGALAWELRAATSLAELDARSGRSTAARQRLSAVLRRVREGAKTADVRIAHELLHGLA